jgi:hypothetical protein
VGFEAGGPGRAGERGASSAARRCAPTALHPSRGPLPPRRPRRHRPPHRRAHGRRLHQDSARQHRHRRGARSGRGGRRAGAGVRRRRSHRERGRRRSRCADHFEELRRSHPRVDRMLVELLAARVRRLERRAGGGLLPPPRIGASCGVCSRSPHRFRTRAASASSASPRRTSPAWAGPRERTRPFAASSGPARSRCGGDGSRCATSICWPPGCPDRAVGHALCRGRDRANIGCAHDPRPCIS